MNLRHGLLVLMFVILSPIPLLLRAEVIPPTGLPILLTGSGNSSPTRVPAGRSPASTYRMTLIKVFDREGWSQPVEAYRILIPSDWKVDGWAHWRQGSIGCPDNIIDAGLRAVAPDGITGIEIFPPFSWQWVQDPQMRQVLQQQEQMNVRLLGPNGRGCPMMGVMTAADALRTLLIPQYRKDAQIVATEELPEVARATDAQVRPNYAALLQAGLLTAYHVDAARVHLVTTVGGSPAEEFVSATITVTQQSMPSMTAMMQGRAGSSFLYGISGFNFIATRAPKGQLEADRQLFAAIVGSLRPNLIWMNAIQQVIINMKNVQSKGAADRAAIWRKAQQEISQIHNEAYQHQQAVNDRLAKQFDQTIRGVQTYVDPSTKESVELTSGYKQYWTNGQGEYILSDDASFHPQGNWHLMEPAK